MYYITMCTDLLDYLQMRGICERWVLEWYYYNKEEMKKRDFALYLFAHRVHLKYCENN